MSKRIYIFGAGSFGIHLARRLVELDADVVVADQDPAIVADLAEKGFNAVELDAADEDALAESGVADADAAVVAIGDNLQASLLATLSLRDLKVPKIVARAGNSKHGQALVRLGAHRVVLPLRDTAWSLAERLLEHAISPRHPLSGHYQIAEIRATQMAAADPIGLRRRIAEFDLRLVLAERAHQGRDPETLLPEEPYVPRQGDTLFLIGTRDRLNQFEGAIADQTES